MAESRYTSNGTFNVPAFGMSTVDLFARASGSGGTDPGAGTGGDGGGGGQLSIKRGLAVTPLAAISIFVGPAAAVGANGSDSFVDTGLDCLAKGAIGSAGGTGGVGDTLQDGGPGGAGGLGLDGGGGGGSGALLGAGGAGGPGGVGIGGSGGSDAGLGTPAADGGAGATTGGPVAGSGSGPGAGGGGASAIGGDAAPSFRGEVLVAWAWDNPLPRYVDYQGGPAGAGLPLMIIGTGFSPGCTVLIGDLAATVLGVDDATQIRILTPAVEPGKYTLTVTNADGVPGDMPGGISFLPIPPGYYNSDVVRLSVYNWTAGPQLGIGDLVEASGACGYVPIFFRGFKGIVAQPDGSKKYVAGSYRFDATTSAPPQTVTGWFLTNAGGTILRCAGKLPVPVPLWNALDSVVVVPSAVLPVPTFGG